MPIHCDFLAVKYTSINPSHSLTLYSFHTHLVKRTALARSFPALARLILAHLLLLCVCIWRCGMSRWFDHLLLVYVQYCMDVSDGVWCWAWWISGIDP